MLVSKFDLLNSRSRSNRFTPVFLHCAFCLGSWMVWCVCVQYVLQDVLKNMESKFSSWTIGPIHIADPTSLKHARFNVRLQLRHMSSHQSVCDTSECWTNVRLISPSFSEIGSHIALLYDEEWHDFCIDLHNKMLRLKYISPPFGCFQLCRVKQLETNGLDVSRFALVLGHPIVADSKRP